MSLPQTTRIDALDRPADEVSEQALHIRTGLVAEYRHLLCDADPDSVVPPFPYLIKSRPERGEP